MNLTFYNHQFRLCLVGTLALTFSFITGCAKTEQDGHSAALEPYIQLLEAEYLETTGEELNTDVPIHLKKLDGTRRGICRKKKGINGTIREIFIDEETFEQNKDNFDAITTIILHEIGHCVYDLHHDSNMTTHEDHRIPTSIMYPRTIHTIYLIEGNYKDYYYREFQDRVNPELSI